MKRIVIAIAAACGTAACFGAAAQDFTRTDVIEYADNTTLWVMGQPKSSTTSGLVEYRHVYDPVTALPIETYAFGKLKYKATYHPDGTLATVSDGRDTPTYNTTIGFSQWKRGTPQLITYPDAKTKSAVVDNIGQITSVTNEVGAKTCYTYDPMGRIKQITHPSETQLGVCDTTAWAPTTITFSGGYPAAYGMPAGHWRQTTLTGNGRKVLLFDALWRPVVEQHLDLGNVAGTMTEIIRRYDADGRTVFESYPMNTAGTAVYSDTTLKGTRTTYDAIGRPTLVQQDSEYATPLQTTYDYLTNFATKVKAPGGQLTTTYFQTFDQPTTDYPRAIAHPEGAITDIPRDVFGKPQYITRRVADWSTALTRWYAYNDAQELCRTTEPETGVTLMGYDAAGNLAWSASGLAAGTPCNDDTQATRDRKSTRTYDNRNRLVELQFADDVGEQVWSYTDDGLPATVLTYNGLARSEVVQNTYVYNKRRLLTGESVHQPGYTWSMGYGYNANGFLTAQTYPDTSSTTFAVDARGRTTGITGTSGTYVSNATYHPNGALKQFTYGNGIVHTMTQNARGLPDRSLDVYAGSTPVLDDSFDYDFNGNVAAISDGRSGARGNRTMTYDGLDRLKSVASPMYNGTISYTYDVLDNIQTLTAPANPARNRAARNLRYCYKSGTNRLEFLREGAANCSTGSATGAFDFDVQGNVDVKNAWNFDFSQDNRLRVAKESSVVKEQYRYDAYGRRVNSESPTLAAIRAFYGQSGALAYQNDLRQGKSLSHVYLGGSLVTTREQTTASGAVVLKFHHTDALGSPIAVTGVGRNEVDPRSDYEPYGEVISRPHHDRPGYTGHVEDAQSGLTYMQQRYYDSTIGRFVSVDPVAARAKGDNFNRYVYARSNPYLFTDPDGRESPCFSNGNASCGVDLGQAKQNATNLLVGALGLLTGTDPNYVAPPGSGQVSPAASPVELAGASGILRGATSTFNALRGLTARAPAIVTPRGPALQASSAEAQSALTQVQNGATVYRAGEFGTQNAANGQYWALQNPATTPGYAGQMGMPGGAAPRFDWIIGGRVAPGEAVITRPAPGIGANSGGAMEAVVNPGGVRLDWFHMP